MFPFCFEWRWDIGHFIFMGLFYLAVSVVGTGLLFAAYQTYRKLKKEEETL